MIVPLKKCCLKFKQWLLKKEAAMLVTTSPYIAIYGIIYGWQIAHVFAINAVGICKTYTPIYGKADLYGKPESLLGIRNGGRNNPT